MAEHAPPSISVLVPDSDIRTQVAVWKSRTGGTQYELAQALGISPSFLSQIVRGHRPGRNYVDRIREVTNRSIA